MEQCALNCDAGRGSVEPCDTLPHLPDLDAFPIKTKTSVSQCTEKQKGWEDDDADCVPPSSPAAHADSVGGDVMVNGSFHPPSSSEPDDSSPSPLSTITHQMDSLCVCGESCTSSHPVTVCDGDDATRVVTESVASSSPVSARTESTGVDSDTSHSPTPSTCCLETSGITIVPYESERQMADIMKLITKDLSEPYSIYTYRYFINNWPHLCFLAQDGEDYVGAIVCKLDVHKKVIRRGYIAMLAVDNKHRRKKIGTSLVLQAIDSMIANNCDEVVLETEVTNTSALKLYENLGFSRDKRLFRYYLNGVDALRLKLWLR